VAGAKVRIKDGFPKVARKAREASIKNLGRAGAYIRGVAAKSIKVAPEYSKPGHQPHSRKGQLKKAIRFSVEKQKQGVVIGPDVSTVGKIGRTHEFGGTEPPKKRKKRTQAKGWKLEVGGLGPLRIQGNKPVVARLKNESQVQRAKQIVANLPVTQVSNENKSRKYPARPFMGPALKIAQVRLPALWANSIKGG
jgi:hypothetical protein